MASAHYEPLQEWADKAGQSVDAINYVVCLLLVYPIAVLFRFIPTEYANLRHATAGIVGLAFGWLCFRETLAAVVVQALVCWLLMKLGGAQQHLYVNVFAMAFLLLGHAWRQYYHYGSYILDVTGPMMILTQKVTQLAFSIHDGKYADSSKLSPEQKALATSTVPSFLQFFGHIFAFFSFLAGPNHQYQDYINMIEGRGDFGRPPSAFVVALKKILGACLCMVVSKVPGLIGYDATYVLLINQDFLEKNNYFMRVVHMVVSSIVVRMKYYFAWILADGGNNMAGLGYNGRDKATGAEKWDRITNVNVLNVEFATSFKNVLDNWNIQTSKWLRYVCYDRTNESVSKSMLLSAVWHGLYPGYYMTFLTGALLTNASRQVRRTVRDSFQSSAFSRNFYDIITSIVSLTFLAYLVGPFLTLNIEDSFKLWQEFYFAGHIILFVIVLSPIGKGKSASKKPSAGKDEKAKDGGASEANIDKKKAQ